MAWTDGGRERVEDNRRVDVQRWQRDGLIPSDDSVKSFQTYWTVKGEQVANIGVIAAADYVRLRYRFTRQGHEPVSVDSEIRLTRTACNYGNSRVWFRCPHCQKRRVHMYLNGWPACRTCSDFRYSSQVENLGDRYYRKSCRIGDLIERRGGVILSGEIIGKPPNMHHATFERLSEAHHYYRMRGMYHGLALLGITRNNPWDKQTTTKVAVG